MTNSFLLGTLSLCYNFGDRLHCPRVWDSQPTLQQTLHFLACNIVLLSIVWDVLFRIEVWNGPRPTKGKNSAYSGLCPPGPGSSTLASVYRSQSDRVG